MASPDNRRRNTDVTKLIASEHEVTILGSCLNDIVVKGVTTFVGNVHMRYGNE